MGAMHIISLVDESKRARYRALVLLIHQTNYPTAPFVGAGTGAGAGVGATGVVADD